MYRGQELHEVLRAQIGLGLLHEVVLQVLFTFVAEYGDNGLELGPLLADALRGKHVRT